MKRYVEPVGCAAHRCARVVERSSWVCRRCYGTLPAKVRAAIERAQGFASKGDAGAKRVMVVLRRQCLLFWRGGEPAGLLWRASA